MNIHSNRGAETLSSLVRGIVSVFTFNGPGMAAATRGFSLWWSLLLVVIIGLPMRYAGVFWMIQAWLIFGLVAWAVATALNDPPARERLSAALRLTSWCALPMLITFTVFRSDIFDNLGYQIVPGLWCAVAWGLGWSALTGASTIKSVISGLVALIVASVVQLLWILLIIVSI